MKKQIQNLKRIYKMDIENIDKNLEFIPYILFRFFDGF